MTDLHDLSRLVGAVRRKRATRPLVTPCCGTTPELRGGRLHCPGAPYEDCTKSYATLGELVVAKEAA